MQTQSENSDRTPPGLTPAVILADHHLRSVMERPDLFLAAFFSSMPEPVEGTSSEGSYCLPQMDVHAVQNALVRQGRAPYSGEPPCSSSSSLSIHWLAMSSFPPTLNIAHGIALHAANVSLVPPAGSSLARMVPLRFGSVESVPAVALVTTAIDSHLDGLGEWGCAVTPPLSLTDETFALPGLLEEQAS